MAPIRLDLKNGTMDIDGAPLAALRWLRAFPARLARACVDFAGYGGEATYLWPRWLFLRLVGVVFIFVFAGWIIEGPALVGPGGVEPIGDFLDSVLKQDPSLARFVFMPTVFWLSSGAKAITVAGATGLLAAVALVLNLWPRLALFVCWLIQVSFVSACRELAPAQLDGLVLELALLSIPFAPRGLRPGLGRDSPPHRFATFCLRWMVFRVMFQSGLVKLWSTEKAWHDLGAMDRMYETAPFPTILGYLDHNLSHGWHLFEGAFTYVAELFAPLAALAGRRGRWIAIPIWVVFQIGIQVTNNFGWLNVTAIVMGLLLLDDQMIERAASLLGRRRITAPVALPAKREVSVFRVLAFYVPLLMGLYFSSLEFGVRLLKIQPVLLPRWMERSMLWAGTYRSANAYTLYEFVAMKRHHVEFQGTDDGGVTWKTYGFRFQPQALDRTCPFIAPYFARFEATMQIMGQYASRRFIAEVGRALLEGNRELGGLFRENPFPDHPPQAIRFPYYEFKFTDLETRRRTGNYWSKQYLDEYFPPLSKDPKTGKVRMGN
ncbi:MAG: lipase maturation factor family protein [Deltaproteobacteria bacterium]|nr:lipase maturation factor family protein [Deltaproteobacteria bacterium]